MAKGDEFIDSAWVDAPAQDVKAAPVWRRWWFWLLVVVILIAAAPLIVFLGIFLWDNIVVNLMSFGAGF